MSNIDRIIESLIKYSNIYPQAVVDIKVDGVSVESIQIKKTEFNDDFIRNATNDELISAATYEFYETIRKCTYNRLFDKMKVILDKFGTTPRASYYIFRYAPLSMFIELKLTIDGTPDDLLKLGLDIHYESSDNDWREKLEYLREIFVSTCDDPVKSFSDWVTTYYNKVSKSAHIKHMINILLDGYTDHIYMDLMGNEKLISIITATNTREENIELAYYAIQVRESMLFSIAINKIKNNRNGLNNLNNSEIRALLLEAVNSGTVLCIRKLFKCFSANTVLNAVNEYDRRYDTGSGSSRGIFLGRAIFHGHLKVLEDMIDHWRNYVNENLTDSMLYTAAHYGHTNLLDLLLKEFRINGYVLDKILNTIVNSKRIDSLNWFMTEFPDRYTRYIEGDGQKNKDTDSKETIDFHTI